MSPVLTGQAPQNSNNAVADALRSRSPPAAGSAASFFPSPPHGSVVLRSAAPPFTPSSHTSATISPSFGPQPGPTTTSKVSVLAMAHPLVYPSAASASQPRQLSSNDSHLVNSSSPSTAPTSLTVTPLKAGGSTGQHSYPAAAGGEVSTPPPPPLQPGAGGGFKSSLAAVHPLATAAPEGVFISGRSARQHAPGEVSVSDDDDDDDLLTQACVTHHHEQPPHAASHLTAYGGDTVPVDDKQQPPQHGSVAQPMSWKRLFAPPTATTVPLDTATNTSNPVNNSRRAKSLATVVAGNTNTAPAIGVPSSSGSHPRHQPQPHRPPTTAAAPSSTSSAEWTPFTAGSGGWGGTIAPA